MELLLWWLLFWNISIVYVKSIFFCIIIISWFYLFICNYWFSIKIIHLIWLIFLINSSFFSLWILSINYIMIFLRHKKMIINIVLGILRLNCCWVGLLVIVIFDHIRLKISTCCLEHSNVCSKKCFIIWCFIDQSWMLIYIIIHWTLEWKDILTRCYWWSSWSTRINCFLLVFQLRWLIRRFR